MIRNRGRFAPLLATLVAALLATPLLPDALLGLPSLQVFFSATFVAGVYAVSRERRVLIRGSALAAVALALSWWRELGAAPAAGVALANCAAHILFFGFVAVAVLRAVLAERRVSADTIYGGISVYLLLATLWAVVYSAIAQLAPTSFASHGAALSGRGVDAALSPELIYFSFVTIATLGYGDIVPVSDAARAGAAAEAVVGQLYVAVFIARLVGLHLADASRE